MKVPFWTAIKVFKFVYNWCAVILYNNLWENRKITAEEAENLINQLSKILKIPTEYDTNLSTIRRN